MRKYLMLIFISIFLTGCPGNKGPEVSLVCSAVEGIPGTTISFDANESAVVGDDSLIFSNIKILMGESDEYSETQQFVDKEETEFAKYSYQFKKIGTYKVEVSLSDSKGRTGSAVSEIVIVPAISASQTLTLAASNVYQDMPFSFDANSLEIPAEVSCEWLVWIKSEPPKLVFSSSLASFTKESGFADPGEYDVKLMIVDEFGNDLSFCSTFTVLDVTDPDANFVISRQDGEEGIFYEYQTVIFDASTSKADNMEDSTNTLVNFQWYLSKRVAPELFEVLPTSIEKQSSAPFEMDLLEAGTYKIELEVESSIGKKNLADAFLLTVKPSFPEILSASLSSDIGQVLYDGKAATFNISVNESPFNLKKGKISKILIDFENESFSDIEHDIDLSTASTSIIIPWIPPYDENSSEQKTYNGTVRVINEGGRASQDFALNPIPIVKSNRPVVVLNCPDSYFFDKIITFSANGTLSPSGDLKAVLISLWNVDDGENPVECVAVTDISSDLTQELQYEILSGTGESHYELICSAENFSGSVLELKKEILVTEAKISARLSLTPEPEMIFVYSGQAISFDARSSQMKNGNIPDSFDWTIQKVLNGGAFENLSSEISPANQAENEGYFSFLFENPGTYRIDLTVLDETLSESDSYSRTLNIKDNTPEITINEPTDDNAGHYTFTGQATSPDGTAVTQYKWYVGEDPASSGSTVKSTTSELTATFLEGTHYVYLVATNSSNIGAVKSFACTAKDLIAPLAPLVNAVTPTCLVKPSWTWNPVDADDVQLYRYFLAEDNVVPLDRSSIPWLETANSDKKSFVSNVTLSDGVHTLYVQAKDFAGPDNNWPTAIQFDDPIFTGSFELTVDTVKPEAPDVTVVAITNDKTPTWSWTPKDENDASAYRYQIDPVDPESDNGWTEIGTALTYTPFDEVRSSGSGDHFLYVQTQDEAGNWSLPGIGQVTIDLVAPPAPIVSSESTYTNDQTPYFDFGASVGEAVTGYRFQVDSEGWEEVLDLTTLPASVIKVGDDYRYQRGDSQMLSSGTPDPLPNGLLHTFYVCAQDEAGNWSESTGYNITIDTKPYDASIISISGVPSTKNRKPSWNIINNPSVSEYRCQVNAQSADQWVLKSNPTLSYQPTEDLADGRYELFVQAKDQAGNWSPSASLVTYVDNVAPQIEWKTGPSLDSVRVLYQSGDYFVSKSDVVANDNVDNLITDMNWITISYLDDKPVDHQIPANYQANWSVRDYAGNVAVKTSAVMVHPPLIDIDSLSITYPLYVEAASDARFEASGVVAPGNPVNSFGGDVVYTWSVTGAKTYTDTNPTVDAFEIINMGDSAATIDYDGLQLSLTVGYQDAQLNFLSKTSAPLAFKLWQNLDNRVVNGDFETGASSTAPWIGDHCVYRETQWSGFSEHWKSNYSSVFISDEKSVRVAGPIEEGGNRCYLLSNTDKEWHRGSRGRLMQNDINVSAGVRYRLSFDVWNMRAGGAGINGKNSDSNDAVIWLDVNGMDATFSATHIAFSSNLPTARLYGSTGDDPVNFFRCFSPQEMTDYDTFYIDFTSVSDADLRISLWKGDYSGTPPNDGARSDGDWNDYGEARFDNIKLDYVQE